jgi:uncharacterized protein
MKITVKVKPGSKEESVEKTPDGSYLIRVKAKPVEGKATEAVIKALADHFGISKSRVRLIKGQTSKIKIFEIL